MLMDCLYNFGIDVFHCTAINVVRLVCDVPRKDQRKYIAVKKSDLDGENTER